jgi:hypothetical protein
MNGATPMDAELLDDILNTGGIARDRHLITAKLLAHASGYSVKTISDYRRGKLTIPSQFWRAAWNVTRMRSIPNLILADTPCDITIHDHLRRIEGDAAVLAQAIEAVGDFHKRQSYLADILKDGRIDEADRDAVAKYNEAYHQGRQHEAGIHFAINREFEAAQQETA